MEDFVTAMPLAIYLNWSIFPTWKLYLPAFSILAIYTCSIQKTSLPSKQSMLICLDTEFTGLNQAKPDLISIGLVDMTGREFYAELPEHDWTVQCTEWVHFNVLPHLWGGQYVQSKVSVQELLTNWIENIPSEAVIVTDFAESDFFKQLKPLLTPRWPKNLHMWPIQFSTWSLGDDRESELRKIMNDYHSPNRPAHHALHDAHALRLALQYAILNGWHPENHIQS